MVKAYAGFLLLYCRVDFTYIPRRSIWGYLYAAYLGEKRFKLSTLGRSQGKDKGLWLWLWLQSSRAHAAGVLLFRCIQ